MGFFRVLLSLMMLFSSLDIFADTWNILIASVPKAGTHLVADCVVDITHRQLAYGFPILGVEDLNEAVIKKANASNFFVTHLPYHEEYDKMLRDSGFRGILIFRDPRDQIVSFLEWIYQHPENWPQLKHMNRDELLSKLISCKDYAKYDLPTDGIVSQYNQYLFWRKSPHFYAVKFESLVGPQAREEVLEKTEKRKIEKEQFKVVSQIAQHIGSPINEQEAKKIGRNLFGRSLTFRKGKTGNWRHYFKPKHKEEFKRHAGKLLIELGYEKDNNW